MDSETVTGIVEQFDYKYVFVAFTIYAIIIGFFLFYSLKIIFSFRKMWIVWLGLYITGFVYYTKISPKWENKPTIYEKFDILLYSDTATAHDWVRLMSDFMFKFFAAMSFCPPLWPVLSLAIFFFFLFIFAILNFGGETAKKIKR